MINSYFLSKRILFAVFFLNLCLLTQAQGQTLLINEFMASNNVTVEDNAGEYEDWLEIYNYGTSSINVGGMYLSDGNLDEDDLYEKLIRVQKRI